MSRTANILGCLTAAALFCLSACGGDSAGGGGTIMDTGTTGDVLENDVSTFTDVGGGEDGTDDGGADSGADSDESCGTLGCPCLDDVDCDSGFCVESRTDVGLICSELCDESCSLPGYDCVLLGNGGGDAVRLCVEADDPYCEPCVVATDCGTLEAACVELDEGSRCFLPCGDDTRCPSGALCQAVPGQDERFCIPEDGVCAGCQDRDGDGFGTGPDCIGEDPDDRNENTYPGAPEVCDEADNDGDGEVDEGFDLLNDDENCGVCGLACLTDTTVGVCSNGLCTLDACRSGFEDCDGDISNGCEVDLGAPERCGECFLPANEPGTVCGVCGSGVWICGSDGDVVCVEDGPEPELNDCGGCVPLDETLGADCGACAATWQCDGDDALACVAVDTDSDGDGVCDPDDICPGSDDAVDSDGDGTPDGCESDCPAGFYGPDCSSACDCVNGICDDGTEGTGACTCSFGFAGGRCDDCEPGRYGPTCSACLPCEGGVCDDGISGGGACVCDDGFAGTLCDRCEADRYGPTCSGTCACERGTCDDGLAGDGSCACPPGFGGPRCNECLPGFYGPSCTACACDRGSCDDGISGSGSCDCPTGFTGPACDTCASGYYGPTCAPCLCENGTCDDGDSGSGACSCPPGFTGTVCGECADGFFGSSCTRCGCERGACDDGISGTGACSCPPGFEGTLCDRCAAGFFGPSCTPCACERGLCDDGLGGNGACFCPAGWTGATCGDCEPGYYGPACTACSCVRGSCDDGESGSGACSCPTGYTGATCNECVAGRYGPGCLPCECVNGTCNDGIGGTGGCFCPSNFEGSRCERCADGFFGPSCAACACVNGTCADGIGGSGVCTCSGNWTGAACDVCPPWYVDDGTCSSLRPNRTLLADITGNINLSGRFRITCEATGATCLMTDRDAPPCSISCPVNSPVELCCSNGSFPCQSANIADTPDWRSSRELDRVNPGALGTATDCEFTYETVGSEQVEYEICPGTVPSADFPTSYTLSCSFTD